jgi:3-dehydroquinate dehydratase I
MQINYCLPIIKSDKEEILEIIEKNNSEYQYFEVWFDYIEELDETFITKLISHLQNKLIVLFRRKNMEPISMNLDKRFNIISLISNSQALLDLDVSQKEELEHIAKNEITINLILSYHNYEKTPTDDELKDVILGMEEYKPMISKIATACQNEQDALRLLQLQTILKEQNKKHIILGMGKFGTITRVYGTLWGNEMIFAPKILDEQSAEGQLTKQELEKIFEVLNYGR